MSLSSEIQPVALAPGSFLTGAQHVAPLQVLASCVCAGNGHNAMTPRLCFANSCKVTGRPSVSAAGALCSTVSGLAWRLPAGEAGVGREDSFVVPKCRRVVSWQRLL